MNNKVLIRSLCLLFVCNISAVYSQYPFNFWGQGVSTKFVISIRPASIIKVVPSTIQLSLTPLVAGGPVVNDFDDDSYMRVTSIAASSSATKTIQVQITNGSVPAGTTLKLSAAKSLTGSGTFGNGYSITLNGQAQKIIDGVGSCYTGDGEIDGYNLTYRWELNTGSVVTALPVSSTAVVVTYTISQW